MQAKILDLNAEAMAVNAKVANKVFDCNVEAVKVFSQDMTAQAEKLLGARTVNDVVAMQTDWFGSVAAKSRDAAEALYAIGAEAGQSYGELWSKYAMSSVSAVAPVVSAGRKTA